MLAFHGPLWDAAAAVLQPHAFWLQAHSSLEVLYYTDGSATGHAVMLVQQHMRECGLGLSQLKVQCCIKTIPATLSGRLSVDH